MPPQTLASKGGFDYVTVDAKTRRVYAAIRGMKTVGVVKDDAAAGIVEIATPVGVIAAILPSTNPTSTAIYKILIALKAGKGFLITGTERADKARYRKWLLVAALDDVTALVSVAA